MSARVASSLTSTGRAVALAGTTLVLLATSTSRSRPFESVSAPFDAPTSCGPAATVTLRTEVVETTSGGCGEAVNDLVHVEGGAATGLPALGEIEYGAVTDPSFPTSVLLGSRMVLYGRVQLPGAIPATAVTRSCRLGPASRDVLSVTCEGPDPESACTGTLTLHLVTP